MSLIEDNIPNQNEPTLEQRKKMASRRLKQGIKQELMQLYKTHAEIKDRLQNNPFGISQADILNDLGADKQEFIDINAKMDELFAFMPAGIKTPIDEEIASE